MTDKSDWVTIITPAHPARLRNGMLNRALGSVWNQTVAPKAVLVEVDVERRGSAATRNRMLGHVTTPWTAFLDSDDVLLPRHLEVLLRVAREADVDVVYPACRVIDPHGRQLDVREEWGRPGRPFDAGILRQRSYIPVTSLVRTDVAQLAWFGPPASHPTTDYDDWGFYVRMLDAGAKFIHTPEVTWVWHHHFGNTSGRSDKGDAA